MYKGGVIDDTELVAVQKTPRQSEARGPPRFGITSKTSGITGINQGIMELWESEAESTL